MKRIFRQLSIVAMTLITLLGNFKMTTLQAEEVTDADYGVIGAYNAYSIDKTLYEPSNPNGVANEMIRIRHVDDGAGKGNIVYCFNADRAVPDIYLEDVDLVNTSGRFPTYTRTNGQVEDNFARSATNARIKENSALAAAVMKVVYNGYRDGDNNRVNKIKEAYREAYGQDISDAELYSATQKAVWYYTDSTKEFKLNDDRIGVSITSAVIPVYRFLIGENDHNLELSLEEPPVGKTLDLYKSTNASRAKKNYQSLLGTEFVDPSDKFESNKVAITVRKVRLDERKVDFALSGATLQVKSKDAVLKKWVSKDTAPEELVLEPGEYVLEEITPPGGYDLAKPITFTVKEDGSVLYDGKESYDATHLSNSEVMMINYPVPNPIDVPLNINKQLFDKKTGKLLYDRLKGGEYTFILRGISENNKTIRQEVKNAKYGQIPFEALVLDRAGTYVYEVEEVLGDDPKVEYDKEKVKVTVVIEKDETYNMLYRKNITYEKSGKTSDNEAFFTNYFSDIPIVVPKHKLTIKKEVTGDIGDKQKDFTFKLSLKDSKGQPLSTVNTDADGKPLTQASAEFSFTLKHGEHLTLVDLPQGYSYEITEEGAEGYQVTVDDQPSPDAKAVGTDIKADKEVTFVNHKELVPATGVVSDSAPYLYLLSLCLLPLLIWIVKKRVN
ncbi:TPA: thioester-forming surface-anchored protein [Streptococcus suis]